MSYRIALVCEGNTDRDVVRTLVTRMVAEEVDWPAELVDEVVTWVGYEPGSQYLSWTGAKRFGEPISRKEFGDHLPASKEGFTARKALLLFDGLSSERKPAAIILQRDVDRYEVREDDLGLARDGVRGKFIVVIGVARPMIESWILAGFIAVGDEIGHHSNLHSHLGFDPCRAGEKFSPRHADLTKRPKHVLEALTGADPARMRSCYEDTPFNHLLTAGKTNGLADFLDEVRSRLIPALGGPPVSPP